MSYLAASFVWCMLQVTLFTTVAAVVYVAARRAGATANTVLLVGCLAMVGLLTLLSTSPWPRWSMPGSTTSQAQIEPIDIPAQIHIRRRIEDLAAATPRHLGDLPRMSEFMQPEPSESSARPASVAWWLLLAGAAWIAAAVGVARTVVAWAHLSRVLRLSMPVSDQKKLLLAASFAASSISAVAWN